MNVNKIIEKVLANSVSGTESHLYVSDNSFLWDLLKHDDHQGKKFRVGDNIIELFKKSKEARFSLSKFVISLILYFIKIIVKGGYAALTFFAFILTGKKKDMSTSPRVNFIIFISCIALFIVTIVIFIVFLIKSAIFFSPNISSNAQGALCVPQNCEKQQYTYLLNSAECWANTGIDVIKGDEIIISSSGSFFSNIGMMDTCARNNSTHKYNVSFPNYGDPIDRDLSNLLLYHSKDARFGALLIQIKTSDKEIYYDYPQSPKDSIVIHQLDSMSNSEMPHFTAEASGTLLVAVNDIYLNNENIKNIILNHNLKARLGVKGAFVLKDTTVLNKVLKDTTGINDTINKYCKEDLRKIWFYDNVGEVMLNIIIKRNSIKGSVFEPAIATKLYRSVEGFFLSPTFSHNELLKFLSFWGLLAAWLLIDYFITLLRNKHRFKNRHKE